MSVLDVLRLANDRGEIGYAYGGDDVDLVHVMTASRLGLIYYSHDASVGLGGKYAGQRRGIYKITDKGREFRDQATESQG